MFHRPMMLAAACAAALGAMAGPSHASFDPTDMRRGSPTPYARKVHKIRSRGHTKKSNAGAYKGSKRAKRATWYGGNPAAH